MYKIAKIAVNRFLRRNPELNFLKDDLISAAHVAIAERPDADDKTLYNAVNSAIKDVVTHDLQGVTKYQYKRYGPNRHVQFEDVEDVTDQCLQEWLECCANEFEEQIIQLSFAGFTTQQIAAQLLCTESEVNQALKVISDRYYRD